jgi:hypothetical protein
MAAAATPAAAEATYYQAVEEFFVGRRGDPLMLSNADWLLIREWRRAGIPLRVVLRGIADALDAHAHSFSRDRKVGSLRYCAAEVEAARERWERALALGAGESVDVPGLLGALAGHLEAARGLGPAGAATAARLAAEIRARAAGIGAASGVEAWLAARQGALLAVLRREATAAALARIEAEVDEGLAPYRARMPERVLAQIRADAVARRLLETHGLRRLSLFQE